MGSPRPRDIWLDLREWARRPPRGQRSRSRAEKRLLATARNRVADVVPLRFPCLRHRAAGGEHVDQRGDRGEPRIVVRREIDDGANLDLNSPGFQALGPKGKRVDTLGRTAYTWVADE